ncbi:MAG: threonine/serine dehydratase [Byssovorax sp.]
MNLSLPDFEAARARIAGQVRVTPVIAWDPMEIAARVTLKLEHLQIGGSFKVRGALSRLLVEEPARLARGVVTASGGNHGIGVAYAAARVGAKAVVFLPESAPAATERRLATLGAEAIRGGRAWDDAWLAALDHAERTGALAVHPFEDPLVIAGQGTVGLELLDQAPDLDAVLVAIGGGGLIAGVAASIHARAPGVRVVGVEPEGAASMSVSLRAGRVTPLDEVRTIAGTLAPRSVGPNTLAIVTREAVEVVLVSDDELRAAMRRLWDDLRILVEPAGAAAVAALLSGRAPLGDARHVAILVCGANLDATLAAEVVS